MSIIEARKIVGQQIGLPDSFNGTASAYAELDPALQIQLTNELAKFIVANRDQFSEMQVTNAQRLVGRGGILPPDEYGLGEAFSDFSDEFLAQGQRIAEGAGAAVTGGVSRAIVVAAVVAVLYFGAPYVIPKLKAAFAK